MTWLREYLGTIAMALLLAVLTWVWLYSESTVSRPLDFELKPQISIELADIKYEIRMDRGQTVPVVDGRIRVEISGPRLIVDSQRSAFPCAPRIDDSDFSANQGAVPVRLKIEDFPIPPTVTIKQLPTLVIHYVKYIEKNVAIAASPSDVEGDLPAGYRVTAVRARPATVALRVPANLLESFPTALPIERVRTAGRTSSFEAGGSLQLPTGVRETQGFVLDVTIEKVPVLWTVGGVELSIAGRDEVVRRLKLRGPRAIQVTLQGPAELEKNVTAADLFAYVRVRPDQDLKISPIALTEFGCEIVNPRFRESVQVVTVMSDVEPKNRQAEVDVLPEK